MMLGSMSRSIRVSTETVGGGLCASPSSSTPNRLPGGTRRQRVGDACGREVDSCTEGATRALGWEGVMRGRGGWGVGGAADGAGARHAWWGVPRRRKRRW